jgi:hypothetical protein
MNQADVLKSIDVYKERAMGAVEHLRAVGNPWYITVSELVEHMREVPLPRGMLK